MTQYHEHHPRPAKFQELDSPLLPNQTTIFDLGSMARFGFGINKRGAEVMSTEGRVTVFKGGVGVVEPTGKYTDAEIVIASDEAQKPIEDSAVVCVDERESADDKEPVREKTGGGNLTTGLNAAAAIEWSGFSQEAVVIGPDEMVEETAVTLVKHGEKLGAHRHAPRSDPNKTGCIAVDGMNDIHVNIGAHAEDEQWIESAQADLGKSFSPDHWRRSQIGYLRMSTDPRWKKFRKSKLQETVEKHDGVVETLNGEKDAFKDDPGNARHNHWGEFLRINDEEGKSNDRDNATIPGFQVDKAPLKRIAKALGGTDDELRSLALHAALMYQYGVAYTATKNMRVIR